MAVTIDRATKIISVPQADLTLITGTLYELNTNQFRKDLKALEASEEGMVELDTHIHNTAVTVAGTTFARTVEIINGYSIQFTPNSQWTVRLAGSNNNIFDVENGILVQNQVQVIAQNSAGLIQTDVPAELTEAHISATYEPNTTSLRMSVWLERLGVTVLVPTSCTVNWYNFDGSLLFTVSNSSPDAQGTFDITRTQALNASTAYYAEVSVTDSTGTISTTRGLPTGP